MNLVRLIFTLCFISLLTLSGCGENSTDNRANNDDTETNTGGGDNPLDDICANLPQETQDILPACGGTLPLDLTGICDTLPEQAAALLPTCGSDDEGGDNPLTDAQEAFCDSVPEASKALLGCPTEEDEGGVQLSSSETSLSTKSALIAVDHVRALVTLGQLKGIINTATGDVEVVLDKLSQSSANDITNGYTALYQAVDNPANLADLGLVENPLLESPETDIAAIADELEALLQAIQG